MLKKRILLPMLMFWLGTLPGLLLAADDEAAQSEAKPAYVSVGDKMVLNLATDSRRLSFLQLEANVLVKDDDAGAVVKTHIPAIRHQLIVHLSEQSAVDMKTPVKRESVRQQVTQHVRVMLDEMTGNNGVEEVLFTTFLVQ